MNRQNQEYKSLRFPAWLLTLSLLPFFLILPIMIIGFSGAVPPGMNFDEITPQIMRAIRIPWVLSNIFILIAMLMKTIPSMMIASALRKTRAHLWMLITIGVNAFIIFTAIISTIMRIIVINFNEASLAANAVYSNSYTTIVGYIGYPLSFFSIFSLCVGLVVSGILRKTGLIVGAISGLLCILSFFPDISSSMPPFLFPLLMMPVGIGLLRRERQEASKGNITLQTT